MTSLGPPPGVFLNEVFPVEEWNRQICCASTAVGEQSAVRLTTHHKSWYDQVSGLTEAPCSPPTLMAGSRVDGQGRFR